MVSSFGQIIKECRRMFKEFNKKKLFFIKRSTKMTAHQLARESYSYPHRVFDMNSVPIGVKIMLMADLSS